MKQITKQIKDFILTFNLQHSNTVVCFDAMVFFYTEASSMQLESEIHIITILAKNVDVIYLSNPQISSMGFPDMFEAENCVIDFKQKKGLLVHYTDDNAIDYSILIQPTGKDCEPATLAELRQKIKADWAATS